MSGPEISKSSLEAGYERSDVNPRWIIGFAVTLIVATIAAMALMVWLFDRFEADSVAADKAELPVTRVADAKPETPPEPVLQGAPGSKFELQSPLLEMEELRGEEDAILSSSAWLDRNAGVVRIPIDHAKRLVLERGLPARATTRKAR